MNGPTASQLSQRNGVNTLRNSYAAVTRPGKGLILSPNTPFWTLTYIHK